MRYDLNLLRSFIVLVEERSVTRAANRLGMTQPAVSNAMRRLRELFQDPLFIRDGRGIRPTDKALEMAPTIADSLAELDRVVLAQQAFDPATAERHVVVAASGLMEVALVPRLVARLQQQAPGIRLRVLPYAYDLAATGVTSGQAAAIIGRVPEPPDNLVLGELMQVGLTCLVRADRDDIGQRLTRAQFEAFGHVNVLPPGKLPVGLFERMAEHGLQRDIQASVSHFLALPDIVAASDQCDGADRALSAPEGRPAPKMRRAAGRFGPVPDPSGLACPVPRRSRPSMAAPTDPHRGGRVGRRARTGRWQGGLALRPAGRGLLSLAAGVPT